MKGTSVIFDWDGTLIDTDFLMDVAIEKVLTSRGATHSLADIASVMYRPRSQGLLLRAIKIPVRDRMDIIGEIAVEFRNLDNQANLFAGALDALVELKRAGIPLGIFTGRDRATFDAQSERLLPADLFDASVCRNEAPHKPHAQGLKMLKDRLRTSTAIYIGNSDADLECAAAAGDTFIAVAICSRMREPLISQKNISFKHTYSQIRGEIFNLVGMNKEA